MKEYRASHSELTKAAPEDVWAHWSEIENWPNWDVGLDACTPKGGFEAGESFMLVPKGAPQPIEVTLVDVVPNERFVDETKLPFGSIRATHTINKEGDQYRVTHTIEAKVAPEQSEFFEQAIWSGMEQGVAESVRNIVKLAEERK
jgi:hypothetical protein